MVMERAIFNNEIQLINEIPLSNEKSTTNEMSFIYEGSTVHLRFTSDEKRLEDLLINYFKSLK